MTKKDDDFIQRTLNEFQRFLRLSGPAASASYTLLGAIIILSLIGYVVDKNFTRLLTVLPFFRSPIIVILKLSIFSSLL